MTQRSPCFKPFDLTYEEITRRIRRYADGLPNADEKEWLSTLIKAFRDESDLWDSKDSLMIYRAEIERLKLKILQLAAGAYLHVSYDLPRILADHWPGSHPHRPWPTELRGELIYEQLSPEFRSAIKEVCAKLETIGLTGLPMRFIPPVNDVVGQWIQSLRQAAWSHARQLRACSPTDRQRLEDFLLQAVTESLRHTSKWRPWSVVSIFPPTLPDFPWLWGERLHFMYPPSLFLTIITDDSIWKPLMLIVSFAILVAICLNTWFSYRNASRAQMELRDQRKALKQLLESEDSHREAREFVDELGRRTFDYVRIAMENPDGFEAYVAYQDDLITKF